MNDKPFLGHNERVLLYVLSLLQELQDKRLIPKCGFEIHPNGRAAIKQMENEGWKPADAEILRTLDFLIADGCLDDAIKALRAA